MRSVICGVQAATIKENENEFPILYTFDIKELGDTVSEESLRKMRIELREVLDIRVQLFDGAGRVKLTKDFRQVKHVDCSMFREFMSSKEFQSVEAVTVRTLPAETIVYSGVISRKPGSSASVSASDSGAAAAAIPSSSGVNPMPKSSGANTSKPASAVSVGSHPTTSQSKDRLHERDYKSICKWNLPTYGAKVDFDDLNSVERDVEVAEEMLNSPATSKKDKEWAQNILDTIDYINQAHEVDPEAKLPVVVMLLPPYDTKENVEKWILKVPDLCKRLFARPVRVVLSDPPYVDDSAEEDRFYMKPYDKDADKRRKLLRKPVMTIVAAIVNDIAQKQPQVLVGVGQGALLGMMCARPLVVEAACRARTLQAYEMQRIRSAWCALTTVICISPCVTPSRTEYDLVIQGVAEFAFSQPIGLQVIVAQESVKPLVKLFGRQLAEKAGFERLDLSSDFKELESHAEETRRLVSLNRPVYFEDDPGSLGMCSICAKRGCFHRCVACGMLTHLGCLCSTFQCPRCSTSPLPAFNSTMHGGLKKQKFQKGTLMQGAVGQDKGVDPRPPCDLHVRPTDEEARANGFKDAQEWYCYSTGGVLAGQRAKSNFDNLPAAPSSKVEHEAPEVQWWSHMKDPLGVNPDYEKKPEIDYNKPLLGEDDLPDASDATARVAEELRYTHPYLIHDVEVYNRETILDIRDDAHKVCKQLWQEEAFGKPGEKTVLPLPQPRHGGKKIELGSIRIELKRAQRNDPFCHAAENQLTALLDSSSTRRKVQPAAKPLHTLGFGPNAKGQQGESNSEMPAGSDRPCASHDASAVDSIDPYEPSPCVAHKGLSSAELSSYRLNPLDGVFEYLLHMPGQSLTLWVPVIPASPCVFGDGAMSWRKWLFTHCHEGLLNAHRPESETYHLLRRMCYWSSMAKDCNRWCCECMTCTKFRSTRLSTGPMKSVLGDEKMAGKLPWTDVIIDVTGPFAAAEGGERYILDYICTQLKVSKFEPMINVQAGHFSRAVLKCMCRAGCIADIIRSDRGPEMVNRLNEEFLAILGIKHQLGAALTPRHQGLCERNHQVLQANQVILMKAITDAHPLEWPSLLPVAKYIQHTAPQGAHGFSALDLSCAYSIVTDADARLAPFRVPRGLPESDQVARMFSNFRDLFGTITRVNREVSLRDIEAANRTRVVRQYEKGEQVFRKWPKPSRLPKSFFPELNAGPYLVVSQPDHWNLTLKDPVTGELVDKGRKIPLDQIVAGPRRARFAHLLEDKEGGDVRPISAMVQGSRTSSGEVLRDRAGRKHGWTPLHKGCMVAYQTVANGPEAKELTIGRVIINDTQARIVTLQPYQACWSGTRIVHRPLYETPVGFTLVPSAKEYTIQVRYEALVLQVELLTGGELGHGSSRSLSDRGWGLYINKNESLRYLRFVQTEVKQLDFLSGNSSSVAASARWLAEPAESVNILRAAPKGDEDKILAFLDGELSRYYAAGGGDKELLAHFKRIEHRTWQRLNFGHRITFMELFSGKLFVSLGLGRIAVTSPLAWEAEYPLSRVKGEDAPGIAARSLVDSRRRNTTRRFVEAIDPVILHIAIPRWLCEAYEGKQPFPDASLVMDFLVSLLLSRISADAGVCVEMKLGARAWERSPLNGVFGVPTDLKAGFYGAKVRIAGSPDILLVSNFPELLKVSQRKLSNKFPGDSPVHVEAISDVARDGPLWGRAVAHASVRLAHQHSEKWATRELQRLKEVDDQITKAARRNKYDQDQISIAVPPFTHALTTSGDVIRMFYSPSQELADRIRVTAEDGGDTVVNYIEKYRLDLLYARVPEMYQNKSIDVEFYDAADKLIHIRRGCRRQPGRLFIFRTFENQSDERWDSVARLSYKVGEAVIRIVYFPNHPMYVRNAVDQNPVFELVHKDAVMPARATAESAGLDVTAVKEILIPAGHQALVPLGLKIRAPSGTYVRVAPRSGLALKHMIGVGAGVVDRDYTGEVGVVLFNHAEHPFRVKVGDRIAQIIFEKINMSNPIAGKVEAQIGLGDGSKLPTRGTGGFGSTGPDGCASESVSALAAAHVSPSARSPCPRQSNRLPVKLKPLKVLHLFSGPRRECDLGDWFERAGPNLGFDVWCESADSLLANWYNLLNDSFYHFVLMEARDKVLKIMHAGLPCNTWTMLRHLQPGPVPLRNRQNLYGLPGLSDGMNQKVEEHNELLRRTATIARTLDIAGGLYGIENPDDPGCEPYPSVFLTKEMQGLVTHHHGKDAIFDQCPFGLAVKKATRIRTNAVKVVERVNFRCQCSPGCHDKATVIDLSTGEYRSRALSRYPPDLCQVLAGAYLDSYAAIVAKEKVRATKESGPPCASQTVPASLPAVESKLGASHDSSTLKSDIIKGPAASATAYRLPETKSSGADLEERGIREQLPNSSTTFVPSGKSHPTTLSAKGMSRPIGAPESKAPPEPLRHASKAEALKAGERTWQKVGDSENGEKLIKGQKKWLDKLYSGDLSGVETPAATFLDMRNSEPLDHNPRSAEKYRQDCADICGLGATPDKEKYGHLCDADIELLTWCVKRGSSSMWLPESHRTSARGFKHRLITRGPPVRAPLHRLSREATEWVEKAIQEDVARGQLKKGSSAWGSPAFPTQEAPAHKAVKRARRMVVDYRLLNRVTVRKVFLIPDSDQVKATVAGNKYISVGDLKEGFNQCDNEPETAEKMAALVASGSYLPKGLTFGPTNGPEDFQELVFIVFSRRLYKEWFLFLDDLSVATGRPAPHGPGPSGAHDVVTKCFASTEQMRAAKGRGRSDSSDPSPYAHLIIVKLLLWLVVFLLSVCPVSGVLEDSSSKSDTCGASPTASAFTPLLSCDDWHCDRPEFSECEVLAFENYSNFSSSTNLSTDAFPFGLDGLVVRDSLLELGEVCRSIPAGRSSLLVVRGLPCPLSGSLLVTRGSCLPCPWFDRSLVVCGSLLPGLLARSSLVEFGAFECLCSPCRPKFSESDQDGEVAVHFEHKALVYPFQDNRGFRFSPRHLFYKSNDVFFDPFVHDGYEASDASTPELCAMPCSLTLNCVFGFQPGVIGLGVVPRLTLRGWWLLPFPAYFPLSSPFCSEKLPYIILDMGRNQSKGARPGAAPDERDMAQRIAEYGLRRVGTPPGRSRGNAGANPWRCRCGNEKSCNSLYLPSQILWSTAARLRKTGRRRKAPHGAISGYRPEFSARRFFERRYTQGPWK